MPPKKKAAGEKGKGAGGGKKKATKKRTSKPGSAGSEDSLNAQEKLVKAKYEIESLQREMDLQRALNERLKQQTAEQRTKIAELQSALEQRNVDGVDLVADMTRQYKTMHNEFQAKIVTLEKQTAELNHKLFALETSTSEAAEGMLQTVREKDRIIDEQNTRMSYMTTEFENMMNETMAKMAKKLELVNQKWKDEIHLSDINERKLADFGIRAPG